MNKLIVILLGVLLCACGHTTGGRTEQTAAAIAEPGKLDEAAVLALARQAVAEHDTWLDRAEFETPQQRDDDSWTVLVWRLPRTPGGHRIVVIDNTGRVADYIRGR